MSDQEQRRAPAWWELSAPLEVAVMRRMGLTYPTGEELAASGGVWERPAPDPQIVREELDRFTTFQRRYALPDDTPVGASVWGIVAHINLDAGLDAAVNAAIDAAVEQVRHMLATHGNLSLADVMAEFDIGPDEAMALLSSAKARKRTEDA